jgi:hypothetical protein
MYVSTSFLPVRRKLSERKGHFRSKKKSLLSKDPMVNIKQARKKQKENIHLHLKRDVIMSYSWYPYSSNNFDDSI